MEETEIEERQAAREATAREFLCGYQACLDMLNLKRYERKRAKAFGEEFRCEDILSGNEQYWEARMYEVGALLSTMHSGRERLILYYHYIRGESIETSADLIGVSRRTGYRLHKKGLNSIGLLLERLKKTEKRIPGFHQGE